MVELYDHSSAHKRDSGIPVISISEGELCGCIGRSGSGKSALLRSIAMRSEKFLTYINGSAVTRFSRETLITLFPESKSPSGITVHDAILSARLSMKGMFSTLSPLDRQIIDEWSDTFDIRGIFESSLDDISDGAYRTVMLARAFVRQTPLLVLDNPDEILDCAGKLCLRRAMIKFLHHGERSLIFTTNDPAFAAQCADRLIVMDKGEIIRSGKYDIITEELMLSVFGVETIISRNVFNGRPEIQFIPKD